MIANFKRLARSDARAKTPALVVTPKPEIEAKVDARAEIFGQMRETFDLLETDVTRLISDVIAAASATHEDMARFTGAIKDIFGSCNELATAAENAAHDVDRLAGATVELTSSSEEISRRLREVSDLAFDAKQTTKEARASVDGLKASSTEIVPIAGLISSIAKRTNLLALNATIEAVHAGAAGRGFAVVASEVKSLAQETEKATAEIARRIDDLQSDSTRLIKAVDTIGGLIENVWPVLAAISGAVEEQTRSTSELSRSTSETAAFATRVSNRASAIAAIACQTTETSNAAHASVRRVTQDAEKLGSRFTVFLRQTDIGSRRRHDRLPCDRGLKIRLDGIAYSGHMIDLSEGGTLVALPSGTPAAKDMNVTLDIDGIGETAARIVAQTKMGFHLEWQQPSGGFVAGIRDVLREINEENADLVTAAAVAAENIGRSFEQAIINRRLTMEMLFDTDYEPLAGTDPVQYRTSALELFEALLPPLQEPLLVRDSRVIFAIATDRNAWVPVHNERYSQPQKTGETVWNTANSRNRRIFDDRSGLAAARNVRPSLVQAYSGDLGAGTDMALKEIDAPIRVFGRHWGGFRMAYAM